MDAVGLEYPSTAEAGCAALPQLPLRAELHRRLARDYAGLTVANDLSAEIRSAD